MVYFDHNATAPLLPEARAAWLEAADKFIGNPSSPHRVGARADAALTQAREELAALLGCAPFDLVWTSGATESNNLVLHHFARALPADVEAWVSAIEHPCVLAPARHYFRDRLRLISATRSGVADLNWLQAALNKTRPGFVAVMAANNETGVLQPWREAWALCRERGVPFFCDAVQWIGKLPARGLGDCDFATGSAHKFGGPKGTGFVKCPANGRVAPLLLGGPQEEGRRAGTENVAGVLAMMAALRTRERTMAAVADKEPMRTAFEQRVRAALPGAEIVGADSPRLWNTVMALMPATDCRQRWVVKLDKVGFAVSTGSACASGKEESSHVLAAMGYGPDEAGRVLRFSSGWETSAAEWESLARALVQVHQAMQPGGT
ncbi:MAG: cysteine desulfurase [Verrucomicrobia bacterium]|nr:cysteine desulfurase [Verrucomicrobiota bacterium]